MKYNPRILKNRENGSHVIVLSEKDANELNLNEKPMLAEHPRLEGFYLFSGRKFREAVPERFNRLLEHNAREFGNERDFINTMVSKRLRALPHEENRFFINEALSNRLHLQSWGTTHYSRTGELAIAFFPKETGVNILNKCNGRSMEEFRKFLVILHSKYDNAFPVEAFHRPITMQGVINSWKRTIGSIENGSIPDKLGLYFHIPFCESKCEFCYCKSKVPGKNSIDEYLSALEEEILPFSGLFQGNDFHTMYFGGGTPGMLAADQLERLFETINGNFGFKRNKHFTFESTPYTLDRQKIRILKKNGVTRLSMGVQSLTPAVLRNISRKQDIMDIENAVKLARRAGIPFINLDLVAGLEGETVGSFLSTVEDVTRLSPDSIHIYRFYPSNTTIFRRKGKWIDDEWMKGMNEMILVAAKMLPERGYMQHPKCTEAFLRTPDSINSHDLNMIEYNSSVLGLGAYAESHAFGNLYYMNVSDDSSRRSYSGFRVDHMSEIRKYIITNLRFGVDINSFSGIFNVDIFKALGRELRQLVDNGLMAIENGRLVPKSSSVFEEYLTSTFLYGRDFMEKLRMRYHDQFERLSEIFIMDDFLCRGERRQ